jgi:hypothetical protein
MKKAVWTAVTAVALLVCARAASAQTTLATEQINATITVTSQARLILSGPVSFADADPDTIPTLVSPDVSVTARARVAPTETLEVTVVSNNAFFDTVNGTSTIPVAGMTWTATGTGFNANGTMSTSATQVATWTGAANHTGTQTYSMPNSWTYAPGTHVVVLTYTLAIP